MAWFLGQSIVFIVLAFLLGVLVGWIVWGRLSWGSRAARSASVVSSPATPDSAPAAEPVAVAVDGPVESPRLVDAPEVEVASGPESVVAVEPEPALVSTSASTVADDQRGLGSRPPAPPGVSSLPDVEADGASESTVDGVLPPVPDDDLARVEGIGPKISAALHDAGIRTFRQLADSDDAVLRAALKAHNLRFAPSLVTWARQARLLADGDDAGFADLTRRLVAGRDVGRS